MVLCVCGGLFAWAPNAWAKTIRVNALAQIGVIKSTSRVLELAGAVSDPSVGNGGLLASLHPAAGGYTGTATFVNPLGSATLAVRVIPRVTGALVHLNLTATVTGATGRFAGAQGKLTGSGVVAAAYGVGHLRLRGTLRGASGRAAAPPHGGGIRHVNGRFEGIEVRLARNGEETIVGAATGVVPGPVVVVVHDRATTTTVRGTFTMFAAGASLTGTISLRFRGRGAVRSESGAAVITGGAGYLSGARSTSSAGLSGTRNFISQLIALRIRGAFRP